VLLAPRQHGPGPHAGRIGNLGDADFAALRTGVLWVPPCWTGGVGLVPNAAQTWSGVSDAIPCTYRRSLGVSDRSTEARDGAPDRVACAPLSLLRLDTGGWLALNAAATSTGVIETIPSTYWRSWGVSDRSAAAWADALERAERVPEWTARVAIAQDASATTATTAAIVASARDRRRPAVLGIEVETDIAPLL
jgi:hypothetical protein